MQDYDVTLKLLLQGPARATMRALTGTAIAKWLDVELPKVQNLRLDLLGETVDGGLVHFELQSTHDADMALRMAEYCLGVYRLLGRFPQQVVLYVGEPEPRMETELCEADVLFRYQLIDVRTLDGEPLVNSEDVGDNVIAVLANLRDQAGAIRRIVARIAALGTAERDAALAQLMILAGLRRLGAVVEQEVRRMPIHINLLEHEVLGPLFRKRFEEGQQEGERTILRAQIEKRFGALPDWAGEKLATLAVGELEDLSLRLLDAKSLKELLG